MFIEDDYQAYRLAQLCDIADKGQGGRFLCQYWRACGKLQLLPQIIDNKDFDIDLSEVVYICASEYVLGRLKDELSKLLQLSNNSTAENTFQTVDNTVQAEISVYYQELRLQLTKLNNINTGGGWANVCTQLSTVASNALVVARQLNTVCLANQVKVWQTNATAEDFFVKGKVNFDRPRGVYFVFSGWEDSKK